MTAYGVSPRRLVQAMRSSIPSALLSTKGAFEGFDEIDDIHRVLSIDRRELAPLPADVERLDRRRHRDDADDPGRLKIGDVDHRDVFVSRDEDGIDGFAFLELAVSVRIEREAFREHEASRRIRKRQHAENSQRGIDDFQLVRTPVERQQPAAISHHVVVVTRKHGFRLTLQVGFLRNVRSDVDRE